MSDAGDQVGAGKSFLGSEPTSVALSTSRVRGGIILELETDNGTPWDATFVVPHPRELLPGVYEGGAGPRFGVIGVASTIGCGGPATGKFSVEELEVDPVLGLRRLSITFEQHCNGLDPALRGVINYQASGTLDPTVLPERSIAFTGRMSRVVYDPSSDFAYGLDSYVRQLAKIDLERGDVTTIDVTETPVDACVDSERGRLFVANEESSLVTEYRTTDLGLERTIAWPGTAGDLDWVQSRKIYCAPDRLYLTDGAQPPALFTVESLDGPTPTVVTHAGAPGIGRLTVNAANTDLYYWYRDAWNGGWIDTSIHHLLTADLSEVDASAEHPPNIYREPSATPIFLDETRSLVLAKNKLWDATDLESIVHELPASSFYFNDSGDIYAFDPERGLVATMSFVYELGGYEAVGQRLFSYSIDSFFDRHGRLWSASEQVMEAQGVGR